MKSPIKKFKDKAAGQRSRIAAVRISGSILSGLLLALSFPGMGQSSFAFIGLVPLLFAVRSASGRTAARLGLLAGFVFFMLSLSWMNNLSGMVMGVALKASALLGYAVLALYCALYFIPVAVVASACIRRWGLRTPSGALRFMFSVTVFWVSSEYLRSILFSGFPWNVLGVSQYANPVLIQGAEWGGVYLVSACIIWMNTGLFITIHQYLNEGRLKRALPHWELMLGLLPIALSVAYGLRVLLNAPSPQSTVRVILVQPNIPQTEKWDQEKDMEILRTLGDLSDAAARLKGTDLIIWPETALPDFVRVSPSSRELVRRVVRQGVPLLTGSMDVEETASGRAYYNSSLMFDTNSTVVARYNKQHLVPFGEYVPFPQVMSKFTPVQVDFVAGKESTLMQVGHHAPFSVLICFEDTVAALSARAVRNGARWLINQTNDAWFDPGAQSEQHLAHAVFRCVENRVPMARCCNTGITCSINSSGVVTRHLEPRTAGFSVNAIRPSPEGSAKTFYTRHGDAFAQFSLAASVAAFFALRFKGRSI